MDWHAITFFLVDAQFGGQGEFVTPAKTTESSHGHQRSNSSNLSSFCSLFEHHTVMYKGRHPYFSPSAEIHHTSNILFLRFILHQDTSRQVSLLRRKAACWPL